MSMAQKEAVKSVDYLRSPTYYLVDDFRCTLFDL